MSDTDPQTASGKVLWHFLMSLDGFVAGPNHEMDWISGDSVRPGLHDEYIKTTGAVLGGRDGWNVVNENRPYGSVEGADLRAHPPPRGCDARRRWPYLNCRPAEAMAMG